MSSNLRQKGRGPGESRGEIGIILGQTEPSPPSPVRGSGAGCGLRTECGVPSAEPSVDGEAHRRAGRAHQLGFMRASTIIRLKTTFPFASIVMA